MEAVWRRLVFHFLWALAILLTGILSGLRVNAVSFVFFRFAIPYFSRNICRSPQTLPASLLCKIDRVRFYEILEPIPVPHTPDQILRMTEIDSGLFRRIGKGAT